MRTITFNTQAGQVSAELVRCGVAAETRVNVSVEIVLDDAGTLPMAAMAEAGGAFSYLADEPDLYTDADLVQQAG